jgi:hypothetical protein
MTYYKKYMFFFTLGYLIAHGTRYGKYGIELEIIVKKGVR